MKKKAVKALAPERTFDVRSGHEIDIFDAPVAQSTVESGGAGLFAVPTQFASARVQQKLCALAQAEFAEVEIPEPVELPVEELRATFHALAPAVRQVAECQFVGCENYDEAGESSFVERAEVPALLAHFAFVALALAEAEAKADRLLLEGVLRAEAKAKTAQ